MSIQENMILNFFLISGKNSGLSTICFSENAFYANSVHLNERVLGN